MSEKRASAASGGDASNRYYRGARPEMQALFPAGAKTCLDVGCATGDFGAAIKVSYPGTEVWGIEVFSEVAKVASARLDVVLTADVADALSELPDRHFDCVYFNDSLEHFIDPYAVLAQLKIKLRDGNSRVVASIPNIRHYRCLWALLIHKDWRYSESGVMDFTHLRFFTEKSIRRMFEDAGYHVESMQGLSGSRKWKVRIWSWLTFGFMSDIRYIQFAVVASPRADMDEDRVHL